MSDENTRYAFTIPIGDWSGDGHGKRHDIHASAAKPIDVVREAYFAAKAKHPRLSPEAFCYSYEDGELPGDIANELRAAGCCVPSDPDDFGPEAMGAIVAWFLNEGDPQIDVRLLDVQLPPMLPFYGSDEHGRHIGFIGYGLIS